MELSQLFLSFFALLNTVNLFTNWISPANAQKRGRREPRNYGMILPAGFPGRLFGRRPGPRQSDERRASPPQRQPIIIDAPAFHLAYDNEMLQDDDFFESFWN